MRAIRSSLPLTLVAATAIGCQSNPPTGSLAEIKRHQESRLAYNCVIENNMTSRGGISLDGYAKLELLRACRADAEARVW